ncbi:MAG: TadE/TadG family type IV pilus assembly protein [Novosphingobium sp.]
MGRLTLFARDQQGAAAVELALVLPLLLALTFIMFDAANYAWSEHKVVMGVRDAARYAGRQDFSKYTCPSTIDNTVLTPIKNLARTGQLSGGDAKVAGWVDGDVTVALNCTAGTGGLYGVVGNNAPRVTVSTKLTYTSLFSAFGLRIVSLKIGASAESPVMGI